MRTRIITLAGHLLDEHDRRILQLWSGQEIGTHGDVCIEIHSKARAISLERLLLMLGK